jgi:putative nucleotidyltransferase with HDIG domain
MEETLRDQDIHKQLAMARLPSLPQALLQILELAERDDVGLAEISTVISQDTALAAKILSTANSAYYSRGRSITSIEQCVTVIGATQIRSIALNQSVAELFRRFQKAGGFDMRYYWYHVLCVAIMARDLAKHLDHANVDEAYLAGLLHDVGQLALLAVAPDRYLPIFKNATGEQSLMAQEQKAFGLTHAEVGAWLAQRWNLHGFFTDAILYHHESLHRVKDAHLLVQAVTLANLFANLPDGEVQLSDADLAFWNLSLDAAKALLKSAETEAQSLANTLGIEILARKPQPRFAQAEDDSAQGNLAAAVSIRLEAQSTLPGQLTGPNLEEVYLGILRSAKMLFTSRQAALFLAGEGLLRGQHTADDDSRLGEIRIHLPAPDSAIARAYQGQVGLAGEKPSGESLADAQVLRILNSERLLCLPLADAASPLGVLVIGLDSGSAEIYLRRKALLTTFAREGGRRLAQAMKQVNLETSIRSEAQQQFQLHARKIVHEANNPLGVVRNYIALLREQLSDKKQAQEDFDLIESELRRVARILQQLKDSNATVSVAKRTASSVDVNALIHDVIRFCRMGRPELEKIDTKLFLENNLPAIRVDGDKMKQALTNLIFNAAEAMPDGGEVSITTANWQSAGGQSSVEITVSDNGPGLPPNVVEHLYQPVQSQKGGAHQGLGLSIVSKLVEELGGVMQCKTSPAGTSFKILLPAS